MEGEAFDTAFLPLPLAPLDRRDLSTVFAAPCPLEVSGDELASSFCIRAISSSVPLVPVFRAAADLLAWRLPATPLRELICFLFSPFQPDRL